MTDIDLRASRSEGKTFKRAVSAPGVMHAARDEEFSGSSRLFRPEDLYRLYLPEALKNLRNLSRTRAGVSDTSVSPDKPPLVLAGEQLAVKAEKNFRRALYYALAHVVNPPQSPVAMERFVDRVAELVNNNLLRPGQDRFRTWETPHQQTAPRDIRHELRRFCHELVARMQSPAFDPAATAAWVEKRHNGEIHPWGDGCARVTLVLAAFVLAAGHQPLPRYPDAKSYFGWMNVPLDRFELFYRTLLDPYRQAVLNVRTANAAQKAAAFTARSGALGISLPPALAVRCDLGNIEACQGSIESALRRPLPGTGALLVATRAELGTLGVMAVLGLRAAGVDLTRDTEERLALLAAAAAGAPRSGAVTSLAAIINDPRPALVSKVQTIKQWLVFGTIPERLIPRRAGKMVVQPSVTLFGANDAEAQA